MAPGLPQSGNRGSHAGRGGPHPRTNHTRVADKPGGGAHKKAAEDDGLIHTKDEMRQYMAEIFKELMTPIQDQLFDLMTENGVGLRLRVTGGVNDPTYFGVKNSDEAPNMTQDGSDASLRFGTAPFVLLSWVKVQLEECEKANRFPVIPFELSQGSWLEDEQFFQNRVVWVRFPVTLQRRITRRDDQGTCHGTGFMVLRVIPDRTIGFQAILRPVVSAAWGRNG